MFLEYGLNKHGEMVHIDDVARGRVSLDCPYCGVWLIARKGKVLAHHFAHDGETCREVSTRDNVQLPAYDNFHMHLSPSDWEMLKDWHLRGFTPYGAKDRLKYLGLIELGWGTRGQEWKTTYKGKVPFGETTLQKFVDIQRGLIAQRHEKLETDVERATTAANKHVTLTDLQLFRAQLRRVLSLTLYFLEIKHKGGKLYKIGVTGRSVEERAAEVARDLSAHYEDVKIKVLRVLTNQGSIEHYFKLRYKEHAAELGSFTEYFKFEKRGKTLSDLTRCGDRELTEFERGVIAGRLPDAAEAVRVELAELHRIKRIKEGMQKAAAEGVHIGRPAGSDEGTAHFLAKYPAVVQAVQGGASLRKAAKAANVSINTVRKVKKAMEVCKQ